MMISGLGEKPLEYRVVYHCSLVHLLDLLLVPQPVCLGWKSVFCVLVWPWQKHSCMLACAGTNKRKCKVIHARDRRKKEILLFCAGLVPFAIGSETVGSISYPAARCGMTALRPTFGTVGRTGVMGVSESLDKLGDAADCVIVLDTIRGKDPDDLSSRGIPLTDPFSVDITKLTVEYLDDAEMDVVQKLQSKGVRTERFKLNYTVDSAQGILNFKMVLICSPTSMSGNTLDRMMIMKRSMAS